MSKNSLPNPLHKIFCKYDKNTQASMQEASAAFQQGFNPNSYDKHGLTIFHISVIQGQKEGLRYLLDLN